MCRVVPIMTGLKNGNTSSYGINTAFPYTIWSSSTLESSWNDFVAFLKCLLGQALHHNSCWFWFDDFLPQWIGVPANKQRALMILLIHEQYRLGYRYGPGPRGSASPLQGNSHKKSAQAGCLQAAKRFGGAFSYWARNCSVSGTEHEGRWCFSNLIINGPRFRMELRCIVCWLLAVDCCWL